LRVLHVLPTCDFAGPSVVCLDHCQALLEAGVEARVLSLRPPDERVLPRLREAGIALDSLQMKGLRDRSIQAPVADLIKQLQPDLVHTHGLRSNVWVAPVAKALGKPVVTTIHSNLREDYALQIGHALPASLLYLWQRAALLKHHDAIVFVSEAARRHLVDWRVAPLRHPRTMVVMNALHPARYERALREDPDPAVAALRGRGRVIIGGVGSLSVLKNFHDLIRAAATLSAEGLELEVVLAGDGDQREALLRLARDGGIDDRVHFLGHHPSVPAVLRGVDIMVHPSLSEGTPLVVIEAMLMGCAVVASAVGGTAKLLAGEATGLLTPPQDVQALTAQLRRLLAQPDSWRRIGLAAQKYAFTHHISPVTARLHLPLYEDLVQTQPKHTTARRGTS
jgi:glycosyltransferase involved in cell wall biosynthesis